MVRLDNSVSRYWVWEFMASISDLRRVSSYWRGVLEDVERVDLAVSSESWVLRDMFVLLSRLCSVGFMFHVLREYNNMHIDIHKKGRTNL